MTVAWMTSVQTTALMPPSVPIPTRDGTAGYPGFDMQRSSFDQSIRAHE